MNTLDLFADPSPEPARRRRARTARELRDDGITRAVQHANSVEAKWSDRALAYVLDYAKENREFLSEAIRPWAYSRGLPRPPDERAWGGPMLRAARLGHIENIGTTKAADPKVHMSINTRWRSLIYGR